MLADFHSNTRREDRSLDPISRFDEELLIGSLHIGFLDAVGDRCPPSFSIERCCCYSLLIFLIVIIVLFRVIIILTQLVGKVNCDDVEPGVNALHLVYYLLDPPLLSIYLLLAIRDEEEALAVLSGATKPVHHVEGDFKCIQYGSTLNSLLLFLVHWCIRLYIPEEGQINFLESTRDGHISAMTRIPVIEGVRCLRRPEKHHSEVMGRSVQHLVKMRESNVRGDSFCDLPSAQGASLLSQWLAKI